MENPETPTNPLTEREVQAQQLENLKQLNSNSKRIKNNLVFIFWVILLLIIRYFILYMKSALNL